MAKKLAVILLSAAFLLLARSGARACDGWSCWSFGDMTRNRAEIYQDITGLADTGDNYQANIADGYKLMNSTVMAGGEDPAMDTGRASVDINAHITANVNDCCDEPDCDPNGCRTNNMGWKTMPTRTRTYNYADVDQRVSGGAFTGGNTQTNLAELDYACNSWSGAGIGSEMSMDTGNADVTIGAVTRVNYNYR